MNLVLFMQSIVTHSRTRKKGNKRRKKDPLDDDDVGLVYDCSSIDHQQQK